MIQAGNLSCARGRAKDTWQEQVPHLPDQHDAVPGRKYIFLSLNPELQGCEGAHLLVYPKKPNPRTVLQVTNIRESFRGLCLLNRAKQGKKFLPSLLYPHSDLSELMVTGGIPPEVPTHQMDQTLESKTLFLL